MTVQPESRQAFALALGLILAACGSVEPGFPPDGAGESKADAGREADSGNEPDSGRGADAGYDVDSGPLADSGDTLEALDAGASDAGLACKAGLSACGGHCLDLQGDLDNCGRCGDACGLGQACVAGNCASSNIRHVVIIVQENHTFDSYFGNYCTAASGSNPECTAGPRCCEAAPAVDPSGASPGVLDDSSNEKHDRNHAQACELAQMDDGAMDHYVAGCNFSVGLTDPPCCDARNWAVAGQDAVGTYWAYADNGALADRYFQPMAGGTSGNDMYLAIARWQFTDNSLRPDTIGSGCTVPNPGPAGEYSGRTTIADLLVGNGFSFKMYADGYADALAASPHCVWALDSGVSLPSDCDVVDRVEGLGMACTYDPSDFPWQYYKQFSDAPAHIVDFSGLAGDLAAGALPNLAYVKARTYRNEHPGWSTISRGVTFVKSVVDAVNSSPYANDTLIILTWDEGGGFFDHVPPPLPVDVQYDADDQGNPVPYGTRVPFLVLGKFARAGTVSHVAMEHSSVVRFLEHNFLGARNAGALGNRDAVVNNIGSLLDPGATGIPIPSGQ
jgi:phospholipase C